RPGDRQRREGGRGGSHHRGQRRTRDRDRGSGERVGARRGPRSVAPRDRDRRRGRRSRRRGRVDVEPRRAARLGCPAYGRDAAPSVEIVAPSSGTTFAPDEPVTLTATAEDAEDGDLSPAIAWSSSLQGPLGAGGTLAGGTLGPGTHVLTASVTDGGGKSASATTTVVVAPLITLQGSRSTAYTNLSLAGKTKIDLTAATFFASPSNLYPVNLS